MTTPEVTVLTESVMDEMIYTVSQAKWLLANDRINEVLTHAGDVLESMMLSDMSDPADACLHRWVLCTQMLWPGGSTGLCFVLGSILCETRLHLKARVWVQHWPSIPTSFSRHELCSTSRNPPKKATPCAAVVQYRDGTPAMSPFELLMAAIQGAWSCVLPIISDFEDCFLVGTCGVMFL